MIKIQEENQINQPKLDNVLFNNKIPEKKIINTHKFNFSDTEISNTTKEKISNDVSKEISMYDNVQTENNKYTRPSFPVIQNKKEIQMNKTVINHETANKFFCPFCNHCNKLKDNDYDNYTYNLSQANTIINKGFDYIIQNLKNFDKNGIDLFSNNYNSITDLKEENIKDENKYTRDRDKSFQDSSNVSNEDLIYVTIK